MPTPMINGTYVNRKWKRARSKGKRHDRTKELPYIRVCAGPQMGKYVHILVAEAKLGRKLKLSEDVDHNDGNTLNNDWTNLTVRTKSEHGTITNTRRYSDNGLANEPTVMVAGAVEKSGTRSKTSKRPKRSAPSSSTASLFDARGELSSVRNSESGD